MEQKKVALSRVSQARTVLTWQSCCWRKVMMFMARSAVRQSTIVSVSPTWKASPTSIFTMPISATL